MRTGPGRLSLRTRGLRYFASIDGQFTTSDTGDCHWPVVWPGSYETQLGITAAAPEVESREAQHFLLAFPCHGSSFGRRVQTIAAVPATTVDKDRSPGWPLVNFAPARSLSTNASGSSTSHGACDAAFARLHTRPVIRITTTVVIAASGTNYCLNNLHTGSARVTPCSGLPRRLRRHALRPNRTCANRTPFLLRPLPLQG